MKNDSLGELQAGIKIAGRNINNLISGDDITLMAESKEELKSLLMRVKEESDKASWMKHKLESRFPGEISKASDMQMIPLLWKKVKRN